MLTNDAILHLFPSDTEDEEFEGFDESDNDERHFHLVHTFCVVVLNVKQN